MDPASAPLPPALRLALPLAAGIALAGTADPGWPLLIVATAAVAAGGAVLAWRCPRRRGWLNAGLLPAAVFLCGFSLFQLHQARFQRQQALLPEPGVALAVAGRLDGLARELRGYQGERMVSFPFLADRISLDDSTSGWLPVNLRLMVRAPLEPGRCLWGEERLLLLGTVERRGGRRNPGGFDYQGWQQRQALAGGLRVERPADLRELPAGGSFLRPGGVTTLAARLRVALLRAHERLYPDPAVRALVSAMVAGAREAVPRDLEQEFRRSGTVHLLVVSGLHAGYIAGAAWLLCLVFPGRGWTAVLTAMLAVWVFALMTGARPPVLRAALLFSLLALAWPLQRKVSPLNLLAAVFALLLLVNPSWLFDLGFQLSFAAVAGIMLLTPALEQTLPERRRRRRPVRYLAKLVLGSACAQIAVLPLLAYHFGQVSLTAFPANPPMVFLAGPLVLGAFAADLLFFLAPQLAGLLAVPVSLLARMLIGLAEFFAELPGAALRVKMPTAWEVALAWGLLLLLSRVPWRGWRPLAGPLAILLLGWLNLELWGAAMGAARQQPLRVRFLDLGAESSLPVAHLPGGQTLLFDPSGSHRGVLDELEQVVEPYLARQARARADWLILRGSDHASLNWAWEALDHLEVGSLALPEPPDRDTVLHRELIEHARRNGVALQLLRGGDTLVSGESRVLFRRLSGDREMRLVPRIEHGEAALLLSGAVRAGEAEALVRLIGRDPVRLLEWPRLPRSANEAAEALWRRVEAIPGVVVVAPGLPPEGRADSSNGLRWVCTSQTGAVTAEAGPEGWRVTVEERERRD